eukprot:TRINITY_DN7474_c0_g1_i1.p1 TRINITY_DN7474_c0_g1~~TRINITY_DN7474_c0_g1_i1.p1  ORF type:complete len:63 (-),score=11.03 TRINITY_DN7474_c0_g1_i1:131-319(-)
MLKKSKANSEKRRHTAGPRQKKQQRIPVPIYPNPDIDFTRERSFNTTDPPLVAFERFARHIF